MAVYVDPAIHPWRGKMWCHLTADTEDELQVFAAKLGLKRSWFQSEASMPHYDITENKRKQALSLGALELTLCEAGARVRAYRESVKQEANDGE